MKKRIANARKPQWFKVDLDVHVSGPSLRRVSLHEEVESRVLTAEQTHEPASHADDSPDRDSMR